MSVILLWSNVKMKFAKEFEQSREMSQCDKINE